MAIRLLLADPHEIALCGWRQFVAGTEIEVVGQTRDGREVLGLLERTSPGVVLLAVPMPGQSGLTLLGPIRQSCPQVAVILTAFEDHASEKLEAYQSGAASYLLRGTPRDAVVDTIRRAAAGDHCWSRGELRRMTGARATARSAVHLDAPLTQRECEVLRQMSAGLTNRQISATMGISYETVKEHVQHVLDKLALSDRTQAALWAVRHGLA